MAQVVGKRKRVGFQEDVRTNKKAAVREHAVDKIDDSKPAVQSKPEANIKSSHSTALDMGLSNDDTPSDIPIQIVTGSYERVLHGLIATIPRSALHHELEQGAEIKFSETFLIAAHTASIRCLAISPPAENDKRFLATGSSDERINVYTISTAPPRSTQARGAPTLNGSIIEENSSNRSLGSLVHHDRAVSSLHFPTKAKLFSAAEDNTIAISRARDWTVLSSIKAPIPKPQGRPSGDTAAPGEVPAGINDFAIHPSQKLMLSVSRGERCMRLWNLMTGKKAGVLNFNRELLTQAGEGKYSSGEGRRVLWDEAGEQFVVGFERGAVVHNIESRPKAIIKSSPPTKLHQFRLLPRVEKSESFNMLAISTEDGRILFFNLQDVPERTERDPAIPPIACIAQVGGKSVDSASRIKDFELLAIPSTNDSEAMYLAIAASSDGVIRIWSIRSSDLAGANQTPSKQIGRLVSRRETANRITCLGAFVLDGKLHAGNLRKEEQTDLVEEDVDDEDDESEDEK